jgi:MFS family permease
LRQHLLRVATFSESNKKYLKVFLLSLIPLSIIILGEVFKIYLFNEGKVAFDNNEVKIKAFIDKINFYQLIFSPVVGFLSDKYGRKPILILTLTSLITSGILLKMHVFPSLTAWLYSVGAIIPVARATYCDVHITNKRIPNIVNTFIAQSIPWIVFSQLSFPLWNSFATLIVVSFLFILILFFFKDWQDKNHRKTSFEFEKIKKAYGLSLCIRIIVALIISNSLWNMLFFYFEERQSELFIGQLSQGLAFFLGTLVARFSHLDEKKLLGLIFILIAASLSLQTIEWGMQGYQGNIIPSFFINFSFFGGIGLPIIYSFFGRKADIHEQGALYGLLHSFQSLTEWGGSISLNHIGFLQYPSGVLISVLVGSCISVALTVGLIYENRKKSF